MGKNKKNSHLVIIKKMIIRNQVIETLSASGIFKKRYRLFNRTFEKVYDYPHVSANDAQRQLHFTQFATLASTSDMFVI